MERARSLYDGLRTREDLVELIGQPEDSHLDCKEWPSKDEDAQKMLAKAVCGMTNADGGVLILGMKAQSRPKDEPDVITGLAPVVNTSQVASRVLGLLSNLVEPGIVGIEVREIPDAPSGPSGYAVVYVPASEGSPCRSCKNREFYIRIGSATIPMAYWQLDDRFGKRPHPRLALYLEERENVSTSYPEPGVAVRWFHLGLRNEGKGIARFPSLRFLRGNDFDLSQYGIDGNMNFGLPRRASEPAWIVFQGGIDDVIYPGESKLVGILSQRGTERGVESSMQLGRFTRTEWHFGPAEFKGEISGEGVAMTTQTFSVGIGKPIPGRTH
jgi:Putative DNA-binding domain